MEKAERVLLTVLTPTYNRVHTLPACFDALSRQTCTAFEWIVVDDGSNDGTEEYVSGLPERPFPVRYIKKENGGKHTALNAAHPFVHGKYVLILDSDDTLTPDAVEQALAGWARYDADPSVGIVTLLKGADPEHPNCYAPEEGVPVDIMAYRRVCPVSNDACEVIRAELFLQNPFPVFPGETFLSEGALWNRVSFTHKCVYINRVIYLCNYLEGGLSKSGKPLRIRNPLGGMHTANLNMAGKNDWKRRIKNGLLFTCYGFFARLSPAQIVRRCDYKVLARSCLPFGWLLYLSWRKKYL